ncbi:nuclear transport factor 2 family protein [Rhodococcus sp. DMU1]|uniref:nuclear transport factor 2 family protein n=1 Tax=Rhodococcus sp. DMU1 TaxID=2722825 RepID=UPI00143E738C|nr:nuclear transport factor 2 family protein [Rhodococcus sp. DMU1]QIX53619.1 nuclear transport factor 2 family protein [Rhodococcus sp. DMU1]
MSTTVNAAEQSKHVVQSIYDAVRTGNIEAFLALASDDMVLVEADSLAVGGTYEGRDAVLGCIGALAEHYDWSTLDVQVLIAEGEWVAAQVLVMATGPDRLQINISEWWRVRDGKAIECRPYYLDTEVMNRTLAANASARSAK